MKNSILMKRTDIEQEHDVTRYQIEKAVKAGQIKIYTGPAAGQNKHYFRVTVDEWAKTLPPREEREPEEESEDPDEEEDAKTPDSTGSNPPNEN